MRSAVAGLVILIIGFAVGIATATHWSTLQLEARSLFPMLPLLPTPRPEKVFAEHAISLSATSDEVRDHFLGPHLSIRTSDKSIAIFDNHVNANVLISPSGTVASATPESAPKAFMFAGGGSTAIPNGPAQFLHAAAGLAMQWKFIPFERSGRPVYVRVRNMEMPIYPEERRPDYRVPFPQIVNWNSLQITLERTGCYGTCPDYRLVIRGDGTVTYEGHDFVALMGTHHAKVPRSVVERIVSSFRRANYFSLYEFYHADVTDNPAYVTSISFDGRLKRVRDYVGEEDGMPGAVVDVEDEIDRAINSDRWLKGNEETAASLVAEGWDFHSKSRNNLTIMTGVTKLGTTQAVTELVADGAPIGPVTPDPGHSYFPVMPAAPPLENAAGRGNSEMVAALLGAGAGKDRDAARDALLAAIRQGHYDVVQTLLFTLNNKPDFRTRDAALFAAAGSCVPEVVSAILKFDHSVNATYSDGNTALMSAASYSSDVDDVDRKNVDCGRTVKLLVQAGAVVNARDTDGNTPLIDSTVYPETTRALIAAGADVNAHNNNGETALMNSFDTEICQLLLRAGADPYLKNKDGKTALDVQSHGLHSTSDETAKVIRDWMSKHPQSQRQQHQLQPDNDPSVLEGSFSAPTRAGWVPAFAGMTVWVERVRPITPATHPAPSESRSPFPSCRAASCRAAGCRRCERDYFSSTLGFTTLIGFPSAYATT